MIPLSFHSIYMYIYIWGFTNLIGYPWVFTNCKWYPWVSTNCLKGLTFLGISICMYIFEDLQISYDTPNFSQIAKYTPLSDRWPKSPCASSGPNACTARDHCEFSKYFNRKTKGISFFVCARPSKLKLALTIYYWLNFAFNI